MIALDASVLIAHFNPADVHHAEARAVLQSGADEQLVASAVTIAEILVAPARAGSLEQAETAIRRLEIGTIGLDHHAPARLAELRVHTGLKLPDCCVLLAAEAAEASVVASFDQRLASSAQALGFVVAATDSRS